jgi:hypothetical protein
MASTHRPGPGARLTWAEIDRALDAWRGLLQVIDDNLCELDEHPTLRKLEGRPGEPAVTLEGETQARVEPALRALREVWAHRDRLSEVIDQATELRKSVRPWSEPRQAAEIDALLNGPSITLRGTTVPLALRSLVTSAHERNTVTPDALVQGMQRSYADARDAVLAVDDAWNRLLPSFTVRAQAIDEIQQRAASLHISLDGECAALRAAVEHLRQRAERDPLGALHAAAADLQPRLDRLRGQIVALQQTQMSVLADLSRADELLRELRTTNGTIDEARRRCRAEIRIVGGLAPPLDVGKIDGLANWLVTLCETADAERWTAARAGLDRWLVTAGEYLDAAGTALAASTAPLDRRDELAGLLRARRAQAEDLARRGLYLSPDAERAYRQAVAALATRPCEIAEVETSVSAYDEAVGALARSTRPR